MPDFKTFDQEVVKIFTGTMKQGGTGFIIIATLYVTFIVRISTCFVLYVNLMIALSVDAGTK